MADIIKDDTNQMVVCPLVDTDNNLVTSVTSATVYMVVNNGTETNITSTATLTYSANMGGFKLVIPAAAISAAGRYEMCIKGANIQNYNLDGLIRLPQSNFATASSISALNNLSAAQVLTQVGTGLTNFGAATATNVTNATSPLATATNLSTAQTAITAIKAKTDNLPSSIPTAAQIVAAFDADVIDGTYTRIQVERIAASALAGADDRSGATKYLKSLDGTKNRISYTDSAIGRVIVSRDGT
jgi:hypothetical protein